MSIVARMKSTLDSNHILYSPLVHVPTYSAQYTASVLHIEGKEVAKTVVLRARDRDLLAVLPASYHINVAKLSEVVGEPVKLVPETECNTLFPDCEPGAVPPFGELYGLPVYMDKVLAEEPEIVFSAGTHSDAIRMRNSDFVRLVKPRICSFAERF